MHQAKKGNAWRFGMTAHIGVDADSRPVHTVVIPPQRRRTSTNAHDITQTHALLQGQEREVLGDSGYTGVAKRKEVRGCAARLNVMMKPGRRRALPISRLGVLLDEVEQVKARIRAKVNIHSVFLTASSLTPRCAIVG